MTHDAGLRLAAKLVRLGIDDATILNVFQGLLPPNYRGNSLDELPEWIASARDKGFGEQITEKQTKRAADRVCSYFDRSGATLFHDEAKRGYMSVPFGVNGVRHFALRSSEGQMWLTKLIFDAERKAVSSKALDEAINLLEARARFDSLKYRTQLRLGGAKDRVIIDLGQDDGRQIIIKAGGWTIGVEREEKLVRSPGFGALHPNAGWKSSRPKTSVGIERRKLGTRACLSARVFAADWALYAVAGGGQQGSGKSFFCKLVKRIIDPNQVEKARLPGSERDLMIHAKDYFLLSFDFRTHFAC